MSSFILNTNRIAGLAAAIVNKHQGNFIVGEQGEEYGKERLADAMLAMNLDAYRQRYGLKITLEDIPYIDLDRSHWTPLDEFSEVQFYKSLQCFLYQCCEGNVDEKPLYKALAALMALLAPFINENSPEFEAAIWG